MTPESAPSSPERSPPAPPAANPGRTEPSSLHDALGRVGRLEVRAARIVEGFLTGRHESPFLGRSLEFREHRQYARGDDLRHVDWKVWGRQDRLYVKQYEEETNLRAVLLVDRSASMAYGAAGRPAKHEYAALAACALAYMLVRQHDAVGCLTFADRVLAEAPPRGSRSQVAAIADLLSQGAPPPGPGAKTRLGDVLAGAAETLPRRGLAILVSDLLAPAEELQRGLSVLRARGLDLVVLHVLDDDELEFPFDEPTRFEGLEGAGVVEANPRALRRGYLAALGRFLDQTRAACARQRADYELLRTGEPVERALVGLLARRQAQRRAGRR